MNINRLKKIFNDYNQTRLMPAGAKPLDINDFIITYYIIENPKFFNYDIYFAGFSSDRKEICDAEDREYVGKVYKNFDDIKEFGQIIIGVDIRNVHKTLHGDIAHYLFNKLVDYEVKSFEYFFNYKSEDFYEREFEIELS